MKNVALILLIMAAMCVPRATVAQEAEVSGKRRAEILSAAKDLMHKARFCGLITLAADGSPQARVVDPFEPEDDMTVWIGTSNVTRKVSEIERDARVTLLCTSPDGTGYVVLIGAAAIVRDKAEKAKHWKPEWKGFYKDENRGDDYVLIKTRPRQLEIVSMTHNLMNDPLTWRPVTLELR